MDINIEWLNHGYIGKLKEWWSYKEIDIHIER